MKDDIILNKISIIERCIKRIHQEYNDNPSNLNDRTKQDSVILNLQRACEASIKLAKHVVSVSGLGLPQKDEDAFSLLEAGDVIPHSLSEKMKAIVQFRDNIILNYEEVNLKEITKMLKNCLVDFFLFTKTILMH
ncbi:uncharacterized protein YutE (UPF0331/DUF86 family) [Cytobacillus firmus]|uniref:Uncharacterized protein YutE (UPF0331/DUF86 family) n=2 Tax=Cytobacillus TaxID=2675230 RepID=A0A366JHL7_CYTFI|nr:MULTISPECIES: DUF86 domain-containing protein [Cytobacillus]RBP85980.1 uncharacterized protein YutE (UPF0331/DUF86 family) [Cytobacillus firmus]TDX35084.1 uncharacterized protein YutE (UPF0331/DUF86 family) [Cytobacillus oceanisediminis]